MRFTGGMLFGLFIGIVVCVTIGLKSCDGGVQFLIGSEVVPASDLEGAVLARAMFWPIDEMGEEFRFVTEGMPGKDWSQSAIGATALPVSDRLMSRDLKGVESAVVILPPSPGDALRSAARRLLAQLDEGRGPICTHMIVSGVEWFDVATVAQVQDRMEQARAHGAGLAMGFTRLLSAITAWMRWPSVKLMIAPKEGAPGKFLWIGDFDEIQEMVLLAPDIPIEAVRVQECDTDQLKRMIGRLAAESEPPGSVGIILIASVDAATEHRQAFHDACVALTAAHPEVAVLQQPTSLPLEDFRDAEAMNQSLRRLLNDLAGVPTEEGRGGR